MVVSKIMPITISVFLVLFSSCSSGKVPKDKLKEFHLELTMEVKTTFAIDSELRGYPWNKDEVIVACGWARIKYLGYEINHEQEPFPITVNIPIGQSCDFSGYIATPLKAKRITVVDWGGEFYFVEGL